MNFFDDEEDEYDDIKMINEVMETIYTGLSPEDEEYLKKNKRHRPLNKHKGKKEDEFNFDDIFGDLDF